MWHYCWKIVSEYDQEIPQTQTADNPVVPEIQEVFEQWRYVDKYRDEFIFQWK